MVRGYAPPPFWQIANIFPFLSYEGFPYAKRAINLLSVLINSHVIWIKIFITYKFICCLKLIISFNFEVRMGKYSEFNPQPDKWSHERRNYDRAIEGLENMVEKSFNKGRRQNKRKIRIFFKTWIPL